MDMSGMSGMAATTTSAAAAATSSAASMSMDMGDSSSSSCKISMLWNWYTVDTCFLSSSWHNTSSGMFAGSCIGVILLVISLEFLRRAGKEYDRLIIRQAQRQSYLYAKVDSSVNAASSTEGGLNDGLPPRRSAIEKPFRPSLLQQIIRATLHMLQFAVAYFIMLLAMYYNGYIIICIFIGAWLGSFIFHWETIPLGTGGDPANSATGVAKEPTVCCG